MSRLFEKRFIVNTGKGGVGKTAASIAMALAFARQGKRVLIMQMNVPDRMGAVFGKEPVGPEVTELTRNVFCVNPAPSDAMREYVLMTLKVKFVYKAVFENRIVAKFLKMMPGLPELVMLGKAYYHELETNEDGTPTWDVIILDAPATGHGMFLLQIPEVINESLTSGMMVDEARKMGALLADSKRTALNIITLAEELPVNESIELKERLDNELDIGLGFTIANHIYPRLFSAPEGDAMRRLTDAADPTTEIAELVSAGHFRDQRTQLQRHYLKELENRVGLPTATMPFLFKAELARDDYERLADSLTREFETTELRT